MGADMLVIVVPIALDMDNNDLEPALLKAVDALTEIPPGTAEYYEQFTGEETPESEALGRQDDLDKVKQDFKDTITAFFGCRGNREVTSVAHKGEELYITGGMSWGDSPTDAYDSFSKFVVLPNAILRLTGAEWFQGTQK
jgi:hypothetical protein